MKKTCACGMWSIEEYGERCPSCPDFTIVDTTGREWATARDFAQAMYGARHLAAEEKRKFRVLHPNGEVCGWAAHR